MFSIISIRTYAGRQVMEQIDAMTFIRTIFSTTPSPPFAHRLELNTSDPDDLNGFLQAFVLIGCDILYGTTELHLLNEQQVATLRAYLQSIGYDADYNFMLDTKLVKVYKSDGTPALRKLSATRLNMTFKLAQSYVPEIM